jgi:glutamate dehydrogenase
MSRNLLVLPQLLADLIFDDRVHDHVPQQYIKNAIASTSASKIGYEGGTRFINALPVQKLAETALTYIQKKKEVMELMETLEKTSMIQEEKDKILKLLDAGGAPTA